MNKVQVVSDFWSIMDKHNWEELASYFSDDATIYWPNTKEIFSVNQFVIVNKEYPGSWKIAINTLLEIENQVVSVVKVSMDKHSFHAISFFAFNVDKITRLEEYWSEDSSPPIWRKEVLDNEQG